MFGLRKETNLGFMVGCELQQIAFSLFQLVFLFSNDVSVSVESRCRLESPDGHVLQVWETGSISDLREMGKLLGLQIAAYEIPGDGSVILEIAGGSRVIIEDSNTSGESYQITGGTHTIVV